MYRYGPFDCAYTSMYKYEGVRFKWSLQGKVCFIITNTFNRRPYEFKIRQ